jgi:hypothetical protein
MEAQQQARLAFGDVSQVRATLHDLNERHARVSARAKWLSDLSGDLKLGYRLLLRCPLFALGVIVTLSLGIAASTTIYSLVHGVLLRPLPYPDAERMVVLWEHNLPRARTENEVSAANLEAWQMVAARRQPRARFSHSSPPCSRILICTVTLLINRW